MSRKIQITRLCTFDLSSFLAETQNKQYIIEAQMYYARGAARIAYALFWFLSLVSGVGGSRTSYAGLMRITLDR